MKKRLPSLDSRVACTDAGERGGGRIGLHKATPSNALRDGVREWDGFSRARGESKGVRNNVVENRERATFKGSHEGGETVLGEDERHLAQVEAEDGDVVADGVELVAA